MPPQKPAPAPGRLSLDASAWPVVHGTRESLDQTHLPTPDTPTLSFWNSQDQAGAFASSRGDGALPSFEEVMDLLLHHKRGPFPPNFNMEDANPVSVISERVSDTEQRLWTSGFKNVLVFKQVEGQPDLELLARYDHGQFDFRFHGSYAFTAANASATSFLVAMKDKLYRYTYVKDEEAAGEEPAYKVVAQEASPGWGSSSKEAEEEEDESNYLVALTLSTDGSVLVASKAGNVTAMAEDPGSGQLVPVSTLRLLDHVQSQSPIHISNSISVYQQGIYIVTQEEMVRVDLDPDSQQLSFRWSTRYGSEKPWYTSRLGPGSGSTPTITTCQGREVVVITDGELDMGLIYYDIDTGDEIARTKVDFGASVGRTTSEQSVAVRGCQAFVVNNYIGVDGIDEEGVYCNYFQGPQLKQDLARFCNSLSPTFIAKVCPAVFGCLNYGVAMYNLEQDDSGEWLLRRQWARDDVSCGTSIPLISAPPASSSTDPPPASVTYCVGMKRNESLWSLLGLDTDSGADVLAFPFYDQRLPKLENFFANPYYAGVEAVGRGALAIGSIGGVNYLTTTTATQQPAVAAAAGSQASSGISSISSALVDPLPTWSSSPDPQPHASPHDPHWWRPRGTGLMVAGLMGLLAVLVAAAVAGYRRHHRQRRGGQLPQQAEVEAVDSKADSQEGEEGQALQRPLLAMLPTQEVWELRQTNILF